MKMTPMQREMFDEGLESFTKRIKTKVAEVGQLNASKYFTKYLQNMKEQVEFTGGHCYDELGEIVAIKRFLFSKRTND